MAGKEVIDPRDQGAQGGGDAGGRGEEEEESREVKVVVAEEGGLEYGIVTKKVARRRRSVKSRIGNQGQDQGETLSLSFSFFLCLSLVFVVGWT